MRHILPEERSYLDTSPPKVAMTASSSLAERGCELPIGGFTGVSRRRVSIVHCEKAELRTNLAKA